MNFKLPDDIRSAKEIARKFAREKLLPITEEDYEKGQTRRELVQKMGELGFFGCLTPEEYGGTQMGYLAAIVIAEEIAKTNASYCGYFICQLAGPPLTILNHGTREQKMHYIPDIISGKHIALFAATEPDAGSDVSAMRASAIKRGNKYVLSGVKTWITNATTADVGIFWVYTDKDKRHKGMACFIVDMKTEGISTKKIDKMGLRCQDTGEVVLNEVEVPEDNILGKPGEGYGILMSTLSNTRLFAAARAIGVADACIEQGLKYAQERNQFGKPIADFQMIQNQLVDMYVEHEAAKALVYNAALNKDRGVNDINEVAIAKYFACEAGVKAAITTMRIFSSYGFSLEYPIHRYVRDAMAFPITEGTSNIQKVIIARNILKDITKEK